MKKLLLLNTTIDIWWEDLKLFHFNQIINIKNSYL